VLCLALLLGEAARAQPYETPPLPGAPRPLGIAAPQEQTLPNGLRVIVAERRGLPLVSAQLLVLTGAESDPPQRAGLAALTASLLTKGTRRHSAPALASAAEALGGSIDTAAGWNRSTIAMTVTTPRLGEALALIAEITTEPVFAKPEIERQRALALDELKVAYSRPGTVAALTATRMQFGSGGYGHPAAGTAATLARLTRRDVAQLHRTSYRPDNAVLVLAGDIGLADAAALARKHFGPWRAPAAALPAVPPAAGAASAHTLTLVNMGDSGQAGVALVLALPTGSSAERAAGEVTNAVLGGGYSARLNQEIRIRRGLSYSAFSSLDARRQAGVLRASVQTKNASAAEVVGLLQAEIDGLIQAEVPLAEMAARKATLIGSFGRSVETSASLAGQIAALVAAGRSPAELPGHIAALSAVSAAEVQHYAGAHFLAAQRRIAVAGDARQFELALKSALPGLVSVGLDQLELDP
jgi:zinc protease